MRLGAAKDFWVIELKCESYKEKTQSRSARVVDASPVNVCAVIKNGLDYLQHIAASASFAIIESRNAWKICPL